MNKRDVLIVAGWTIAVPIQIIVIMWLVLPKRDPIDDWALYGVLLGLTCGIKYVVLKNRQKRSQETRDQEVPSPDAVNSNEPQ